MAAGWDKLETKRNSWLSLKRRISNFRVAKRRLAKRRLA
jgi:hypothetical protein